MKFSGKMWLNIKVRKKEGFTLFAENANSEKVTNTVKIWKEHFPRFLSFQFWV